MEEKARSVVDDRPTIAHTDHRCVLGALVRRLERESDGDLAALTSDALDAMLRAGQFDRCCLPRYLALAPARAPREVQIPIERAAGIEARVIVWPVGAGDAEHPHTGGWTVFVPVRGDLATVERGDGQPARLARLAARRPVVLRPEDAIRHLVRNAGAAPALTVHVSGR